MPTTLPIACSLSAGQLAAQRETLLPGLAGGTDVSGERHRTGAR